MDGDDDDDVEEDVMIILHQPDDEEMGGEEEISTGHQPDSCSTPSAATQSGQPAMQRQSSATPGSAGPTPGGGGPASANYTPHKKYVNPKLQQSHEDCGNTPQAAGMSAPSVPSRAAASGATTSLPTRAFSHATPSAALQAKLGPLLHVPGGLEMDLSGQLPENVDVDSLPDKPWQKPEADLADYFNYGFTEDTWRLYCHKQQVQLYLALRRPKTDAHANSVGSSCLLVVAKTLNYPWSALH